MDSRFPPEWLHFNPDALSDQEVDVVWTHLTRLRPDRQDWPQGSLGRFMACSHFLRSYQRYLQQQRQRR